MTPVDVIQDYTLEELLENAEDASSEEEELGFQSYAVARTLLDAPVYGKAMSVHLADGDYTSANNLAHALDANKDYFTPADVGPEKAVEEGLTLHSMIVGLTEAYDQGDN